MTWKFDVGNVGPTSSPRPVSVGAVNVRSSSALNVQAAAQHTTSAAMRARGMRTIRSERAFCMS